MTKQFDYCQPICWFCCLAICLPACLSVCLSVPADTCSASCTALHFASPPAATVKMWVKRRCLRGSLSIIPTHMYLPSFFFDSHLPLLPPLSLPPPPPSSLLPLPPPSLSPSLSFFSLLLLSLPPFPLPPSSTPPLGWILLLSCQIPAVPATRSLRHPSEVTLQTDRQTDRQGEC